MRTERAGGGALCQQLASSLPRSALPPRSSRRNILYWNWNAELLYGYSAAEAIGQNIFTGRCWWGKFTVKKKSGERFSALADGIPLYDDDGSLIGLICLSADLRILKEIIGFSPFVGHWNSSPKN